MDLHDLDWSNLSVDTIKYVSISNWNLGFYSEHGKEFVLNHIKEVLGDNVIVCDKNNLDKVYEKIKRLAKKTPYENFYLCVASSEVEGLKERIKNEEIDSIKIIEVYDSEDQISKRRINNFDRLLEEERYQRMAPSTERLRNERIKRYIKGIKNNEFNFERLEQLFYDYTSNYNDDISCTGGYDMLKMALLHEMQNSSNYFKAIVSMHFGCEPCEVVIGNEDIHCEPVVIIGDFLPLYANSDRYNYSFNKLKCVVGDVYVSTQQLSKYNLLTDVYGDLDIEGHDTNFGSIQHVAGSFASKNSNLIIKYKELFGEDGKRKKHKYVLSYYNGLDYYIF